MSVIAAGTAAGQARAPLDGLPRWPRTETPTAEIVLLGTGTVGRAFLEDQ